LIKVSNILSAPFIFDHSYDYSGIVLLFCCSVVLLFCFDTRSHAGPWLKPIAFAQF